MKTIYYVINRDLENRGHHLFVFLRTTSLIGDKYKIKLLTTDDNKVALLNEHKIDGWEIISLKRSRLLFYSGLLQMLSHKQHFSTDQILIHDDVNWKDLIFYFILAIYFKISYRSGLLQRINLVFRYTFKHRLKYHLYKFFLTYLNKLGCRILSDSAEILEFWGLSLLTKKNKIPVNRDFLFPIILSFQNIFKQYEKKKGSKIRNIGVPGVLRNDKGLSDVINLSDDKNRNIILKVNLPENVKTNLSFLKEFGFFPSDEKYIEALKALDFQLFWFDTDRYEYATSSTFFEAIYAGIVPLSNKETFCSRILEAYKLDLLVFEDLEDALIFANDIDISKLKKLDGFKKMRNEVAKLFSKTNIKNTFGSILK